MLLAAMPASHKNMEDLAARLQIHSYSCPEHGKVVEDDPNTWARVTHVGDSEKFLLPSTALAWPQLLRSFEK